MYQLVCVYLCVFVCMQIEDGFRVSGIASHAHRKNASHIGWMAWVALGVTHFPFFIKLRSEVHREIINPDAAMV